MTTAEQGFLSIFRSYDVGPNQMLCVDGKVVGKYQSAITSLIDKGFLAKDRPKDSFYLTPAGYQVCRAC